MQIKNLSKTEMVFTTGQKDGEPIFKVIAAGATDDIDIKPDNATLLARVHAGVAEIVGDKRAARRAGEAPAA